MTWKLQSAWNRKNTDTVSNLTDARRNTENKVCETKGENVFPFDSKLQKIYINDEAFTKNTTARDSCGFFLHIEKWTVRAKLSTEFSLKAEPAGGSVMHRLVVVQIIAGDESGTTWTVWSKNRAEFPFYCNFHAIYSCYFPSAWQPSCAGGQALFLTVDKLTFWVVPSASLINKRVGSANI